MDFVFKYFKIKKSNDVKIYELSELNVSHSSILYINKNRMNYEQYDFVEGKILILGDLITQCNREEIISKIKANDLTYFGGFFYLIYMNVLENTVKIYSSIFNILPVYLFDDDKFIIVSSKTELIKKIMPNQVVNKKYILERILFNYSFSNNTFYNDIKLVPSNHFIDISDKIRIKRHFNISDHFVDEPKSGKKIVYELAECFIESSNKYFPKEKSAISFTSGFDGRTLVGVAKKFSKKIFTYSFGGINYSDIILPQAQAKQIGVEHIAFILDNKYVNEEALSCGLDMVKKTEGNASYARAHYRYAAEKLSERVQYLITGNFGSELFRAFHNSGVMISPELISLFASRNEVWVDTIKKSEKLNFLNTSNFKAELDELIEELIIYKNDNNEFKKNELFYKYIFEEVFRKYFGPEIVMQNYFLKNRSPYLDPQFIKYLLSTHYSGVYSPFLTHNPIKRFKGQLPYCYIMKKSFPPLLDMITGKGYCPNDLLNTTGKLRLLRAKFHNNKNIYLDPFCVLSNFQFNKEFYYSIKINSTLFNPNYLKSILFQNKLDDIDHLIDILSVNLFLNNSIN